MIRRLLPLLPALLAGLAAVAHAAAPKPPVLMVFDYVADGKRVALPVPVTAGDYRSPTPGLQHERLGVRPGNALESQLPPPDRLVELYRGIGEQRVLVAALQVRYFRDRSGLWVPHFLLVEQTLVVPRPGGGWRPFTEAKGAAGLTMLTSSTLPNADGYFPALEFGLTSGALQVDSWIVK